MALVVAGLILPGAAWAQTTLPPDAGTIGRQADTIQRQQQERVDEDTTRILTRPQSQTVIEVPTHERAEAKAGSCQTINRIEFAHSPLLGKEARDRLTAPYRGRCLGLGDVENLLSDITRFYIDKSRPRSRPSTWCNFGGCHGSSSGGPGGDV